MSDNMSDDMSDDMSDGQHAWKHVSVQTYLTNPTVQI